MIELCRWVRKHQLRRIYSQLQTLRNQEAMPQSGGYPTIMRPSPNHEALLSNEATPQSGGHPSQTQLHTVQWFGWVGFPLEGRGDWGSPLRVGVSGVPPRGSGWLWFPLEGRSEWGSPLRAGVSAVPPWGPGWVGFPLEGRGEWGSPSRVGVSGVPPSGLGLELPVQGSQLSSSRKDTASMLADGGGVCNIKMKLRAKRLCGAQGWISHAIRNRSTVLVSVEINARVNCNNCPVNLNLNQYCKYCPFRQVWIFNTILFSVLICCICTYIMTEMELDSQSKWDI